MYKNNQVATTLAIDPKLLIKFHPTNETAIPLISISTPCKFKEYIGKNVTKLTPKNKIPQYTLGNNII